MIFPPQAKYNVGKVAEIGKTLKCIKIQGQNESKLEQKLERQKKRRQKLARECGMQVEEKKKKKKQSEPKTPVDPGGS